MINLFNSFILSQKEIFCNRYTSEYHNVTTYNNLFLLNKINLAQYKLWKNKNFDWQINNL